MHREKLLSIVVVAAVVSAGTLAIHQINETLVINLKDPHPVEGNVLVSEPIPHSDVLSVTDVVVAPATREQTNLWTEAGVLETDGFTRVVLSLHGQLRGNPSVPGVVALVLIPDEDNVLQSFAEGEIHLELEALADPVPSGGMYFSGSRAGLPIAFPRYQIFLYNTTDRSASVNLFAYLTN